MTALNVVNPFGRSLSHIKRPPDRTLYPIPLLFVLIPSDRSNIWVVRPRLFNYIRNATLHRSPFGPRPRLFGGRIARTRRHQAKRGHRHFAPHHRPQLRNNLAGRHSTERLVGHIQYPTVWKEQPWHHLSWLLQRHYL